MKTGIVGLPNVGKSTLFNAITNAGAVAANYPFCTLEPNVGIVNVPDERLNFLKTLYEPKKFTPAIIEFVDIAGLVRGASKGEGLGNKFLSHIREVDAIVHVVRCFEKTDIIHVDGKIDPKNDIEVINLELIFSDLETVQKRIEKIKKMVKSEKKYEFELEFLIKIKENLEKEVPARSVKLENDEEKRLLESYLLLTAKPVIYVANVDETAFLNGVEKNKNFIQVSEIANAEKAEILPICAEFESEISEMSETEKIDFLKELGLNSSGLDRLIQSCYKLLNLISFLTAGKDEVRAWTIKKGTKAPQAAGKIHTDFEKGFIRAEIVVFDDLKSCGSLSTAKEKGLVKSEGKEYIINDGDIVLFRFNV